MRARRTAILLLNMWYVYIIECIDNSLYTGTTVDVERRVKEHNNRKGGSYTKRRLPVRLLYREPQPDRSRALKREIQIKRWSKQKKLALIKQDVKSLVTLSKSRDN